MASDSGRSKRSPAPAKFFKVIMYSASDTTIIPPEFIRRFGRNLPDRVFLKLPNGKKLTEVELIKVNGQTLMGKGWPEFKHRLSLRFGHFLVFEYNGNSQFNVVIFDTSAVEIDYPSESESVRESDVLLEEDFPAARRRKVKVEDQENGRPSSPNDVIVISDDDYPVKKSLRTTRSQRPVDCSRVKHDESTSHYGVAGTGRRFPRGSVVKDTSIAYRRAIAFASRLNPHKTPFVIRLMQKSYVSSRYSLYLPLSFAGPSFPREGAKSVTMVTNGKKWSGRCRVSGKRVFVSDRWRGFVEDNRLKIGDVCIFEVANKSNKQQQQPVWNVIIFRA